MATVLEPVSPASTAERIRHPLQAVRATIRKYILLEGAALVVLFLAAWCWIGLALDWGAFALLSFDWIMELQDLDQSKSVAFYVRLVLLLAIVGFMAGLVIAKMVMRLTKEFSDAAVALVLERRFPKELGDRLITAVEMADPKQAAQFGYSRQMIDKTIQEAGERVQSLPVAGVFDWRRLNRLWLNAGLATVGVFLLVAAATCGIGAALGGSGSPVDFLGRFTDVASIWTERNFFLMDSYWPRQAYVEVIRFQDTPDHPGEMRMGRDEQRPELMFRAVQWVVADRATPDGWRALRWADLPRVLPADLLARVSIPKDFPDWIVDPAELSNAAPSPLIPETLKGRSMGEVWREMQLPENQLSVKHLIIGKAVRDSFVGEFWGHKDAGGLRDIVYNLVVDADFKKASANDVAQRIYELLNLNLNDAQRQFATDSFLSKRGAEIQRHLDSLAKSVATRQAASEKAVAEFFDWQTWKIDQLKRQDERPEVRQPLRERHLEAHKALEEVFSRLDELAASSRMSRTLRKLAAPPSVTMDYRGESKRTLTPCDLRTEDLYGFELNDLTESGTFRVRAADYWTRPLKIKLVPPPAVTAVVVDKEEPAYLYVRLQGSQAPLKGQTQLIANYAVSAGGDTTVIDVPYGTSLTLRAEVDRPLKEGIALGPFGSTGVKDSGGIVPKSEIKRFAQGRAFSMRLDNIVKRLEFSVAYSDLDNVSGRRKFRIDPKDDAKPEINSMELGAVLRKPRFKAEPGKAGSGATIDGYLITPDALIPFLGSIRDDHGLERCEWIFETEQIDLQLSASGGGGMKDRSGLVLSQGNPKVRRAGLIASGLQFHNAALQPPLSLAYWDWTTRLFEAAKKFQSGPGEERASMDAFELRRKERSIDEIPAAALAEYLVKKPSAARSRLKDHQLKDEDGFDVRKLLARIKTKDAVKEPQQPHFLRLKVGATDNNIETGPSFTTTNAPFFFLVVSENDLLAQVAVEEEVLGERIEKTLDKLAAARISIDEQLTKLPLATDPNLLSLSAIRADDVRKAVADGGSVTREVTADFTRILKELEVNRVQQAKRLEMKNKIVVPLEFIVNPEYGSFQTTETAAQKFFEALDRDATEKKTPNVNQHLENAKQTREQLDKLIEDLNQVSIAISQGVTEARNFESLVFIADSEGRIHKQLEDFHKRKVQELIEQLTQPKRK